jgi:hypothetical protein
MAPQKNVAIEDTELMERAAKVAQAEGVTVDELATEALKRALARRTFDKFQRQAEARRRGRSDDQVEEVVSQAIQESRAEQRDR